jgi:hypothetical protein
VGFWVANKTINHERMKVSGPLSQLLSVRLKTRIAQWLTLKQIAEIDVFSSGMLM